jgi:hypothetical protein
MNPQEIANYFSKQYNIEVILEGVSLRNEDKVLYIPIVFPEQEIKSLIQACHLLSCRAKYNTKPPKHLSPWEKKTWKYFEDKRICKMDLIELYKSFDLSVAKGLDLFILKEYRKNSYSILTTLLPETKEDVLTCNDSFWKYLESNSPNLAKDNIKYKKDLASISANIKQLQDKLDKLKTNISKNKDLVNYYKDQLRKDIDKSKSEIKKLQVTIKSLDNKLDIKEIKNTIVSIRKSIVKEKEKFHNKHEVKTLKEINEEIKKLRESLTKSKEEKNSLLNITISETPSIEELYRNTIYDYFRNIPLDNQIRVNSFIENNVLSNEEESKLKRLSDIERYACYTKKFDEEIIYETLNLKTPSHYFYSKISYLLRKYFFSKKTDYEVKGLKRGKLDRFALHKTFTIFKKKKQFIKNQIAISIAINLHDVIEEQLLYSYSISKFCLENNISCEVIGYYTKKEDLDTSFVPKDVLYKFNRIDSSLQTIILKEFNSRDLENIYSYDRIDSNGHCDNESLTIISNRLLERREKRKVLIVLSNNSPYVENARKEILLSDLKLLVNELTIKKVEILSFAIKSSYGKSIYENYYNIKDGNELLEVGINEFCKLLLSKKKFFGRKD